MSGASDIAKLFAVAGGSAAQYQEVERTEQQDGARGRWSVHADTAVDTDLAAQDEAALDAAQPLIAWSIAAVTDEPPPVVSAAQAATAIQSAAETPVEAQTQPGFEPVVESALEPAFEPAFEPAPESIVEPIAEPDVQATPEPAAVAPQSAALSSVFARLMERNEPRADTAPRGKS